MKPCDLVFQYYDFPFNLYPYQEKTINELTPLPRSGWYLDMGLGKTVMSAAAVLFKALHGNVDRALIIVPPILLTAWGRFLREIRDKETGPLDVLIYRGTPSERGALSLKHDIVVVGLQIFKRDYARFLEEYRNARLALVVDEAHCLKNVGTDNHHKVRALADTGDKHLLLLTGTPINSPIDAYGMISLVTPGIYRDKAHFERAHVADYDFYGNITAWCNLDVLSEALLMNSVRLLKEDVVDDLPPITYQPIVYDLAPEHLALYRKLAEEHLLRLKDGGKIDATTVQALLHALGQIICNWAHFAQNEKKVSNGFHLADEVLDELGDSGKLVVFANYRLTNRALVKHFFKHHPAAVYGDISAAERDRAIDRFVEDPQCRVFIGNPKSAGYGIDRLQHVSSTVLFLEPTISVTDFTQALSRVHRLGQTKAVTVKLAVAAETLQAAQVAALIRKEDLVQKITGGTQSIREALGL